MDTHSKPRASKKRVGNFRKGYRKLPAQKLRETLVARSHERSKLVRRRGEDVEQRVIEGSKGGIYDDPSTDIASRSCKSTASGIWLG